MKNLVIVGAGGCGRELLQWARDINYKEQRWHIKGFLEFNKNALDNKTCSVGIIGNDDEYTIKQDDEFICGIGDCKLREKVINKLIYRGATFINLIHPTAVLADTCILGAGIVIYPFVSLSDNTFVQNGTIINSHTSIGHDTRIGECCTISAHCDITGGCIIGKRVFMGSTSHVVPGTQIGDDAFICAGSTVMTRVRSGLKVLGNPAKIVKI